MLTASLLSTAIALPAHANFRPPSAAARWIPCPASVTVVPLYDNDESDASLKGTRAHDLLETAVRFRVAPDTADPDMDMNVMRVVEWIDARMKQYAPCTVYAEQRLDIVETGEWGTADVTLVSPKILHIADYKDGYVPVEIRLNEQMLTYLLGAISRYGERDEYYISVLQPNYNHVDGPFRTVRVSAEEVAYFRYQVVAATRANHFKAGKHCKKSYCPHRGACVHFHQWVAEHGPGAGWHTSEINGVTDSILTERLDAADAIHGWRDELRKEALRRILHLDRRIYGYKVVKSRSQRDFAGEAGKAACYQALVDIGYDPADLLERKAFKVGEVTLYEQSPLSVVGVERMVKQKYKHFGAGKWKGVWDEHFRPHVREFSGGLTLERAIDGRPAHTRGSEFGAITSTALLPGKVV